MKQSGWGTTGVVVPTWIVIGLLALVMPLSFVAAGVGVVPGDVAISQAVQTHMPGVLDPFVFAANLLGKAPVVLSIVLIVGLGLLARGHRREALLVGMVALAQLANFALKLTLESPRPTGDLVQVSEPAAGFGFPSGHTMGTTVLALVLCHVAGRLLQDGWRLRVLQGSFVLMALFVGVSRIETGAHWPSDVLGAWLWGMLMTAGLFTLFQYPWSDFAPPVRRPARVIDSAVTLGEGNRSVSRQVSTGRHGV